MTANNKLTGNEIAKVLAGYMAWEIDEAGDWWRVSLPHIMNDCAIANATDGWTRDALAPVLKKIAGENHGKSVFPLPLVVFLCAVVGDKSLEGWKVWDVFRIYLFATPDKLAEAAARAILEIQKKKWE
jgi:hypothetical protein